MYIILFYSQNIYFWIKIQSLKYTYIRKIYTIEVNINFQSSFLFSKHMMIMHNFLPNILEIKIYMWFKQNLIFQNIHLYSLRESSFFKLHSYQNMQIRQKFIFEYTFSFSRCMVLTKDLFFKTHLYLKIYAN